MANLKECLTKQNTAKLLLGLHLGELYCKFSRLKVKNCVVSKTLAYWAHARPGGFRGASFPLVESAQLHKNYSKDEISKKLR